MLAKIFEEQVNKFPDKVAVKTSDGVLTYAELNSYANKVAYKIIAEGIDSLNCNIALLFEHGIDMVIGTISAIKSGRTYVPLDSSYPQNRLRYMIENSDVKVVITNQENYKLAECLINGLDDIKIINITSIGADIPCNNLDLNIDGGNTAYILYTSGSTGLPKGVMQSYENIYYFIENYVKDLGITNEERMTLFSAFSHDAAIMDIYGAVLSGASLYPLNVRNQINASELTTWLVDEGITIWHSVPTLFRYYTNMLTGKETFEKLRYIVLGGEALLKHDIDMFKDYFKYSTLVNLYGQSEASYNSSLYIEHSKALKRITLGNNVGETEFLLIDEDGEEVDVLRTGEIIVVSKHIALGYWRDKKLTDMVFFENPGLGRFYRTGDLGKLLPDGSIEFIGRKDYQIKIRGYRVELGDIESQLLKIAAIKEAVVIGKKSEQEETFLCAYIAADKKFTVGELREGLGKELPDYMIPSFFIQLDELPLTPNGKIDRKAIYNITLPLTEEGMTTGVEYEAPRNEVEQKLADIWSEILGVQKIGINDNFFELGGHSLKATSLVAKIHKVLNVEVSLKEIFTNPTIKRISECIKDREESIYSSIKPIDEKEYYEMSSAQKRMYILNQMDKESTNYNITKVLIIEDELNLQKLTEVFVSLIDRHEALRTSFEIIGEELVQKVHEKVDFTVGYSEVENEEQTEEKVRSFIRAFDLSKAPLLRVGLVKVYPNKHIWICDMHHIIADGVSMGILIKEFSMLYQGMELPKLRVQYKDYAEWVSKPYYIKRLEKQEKYWIETFKNGLTSLNMPLDYDRKNWRAFEGNTIHFKIKKEIVQQLEELARHENTTLNTLMLSLYNILLFKYCEQKDIIVGSTVANRNYADLENMVGIFINFLPIRSNVNSNIKVIEYIQSYKTLLQEVYNNQDYPFDKIVQNATSTIRNSRNPIFDTMLIFHNEVDLSEDFRIDNLHISPYKLDRKTSTLDFKLDITLNSKNEFECSIEYNSSLYKATSMLDLAKHYELLITKALSNLESYIIDIEVFSQEEKRNIEIKRKSNNIDNTAANVVISSTFTAEPLEEHLSWWCAKFGETVKVNFAPYNQVFQELIDPESITSKNTGINLIMVRFEDWIRDIKHSDKEKCEIIRSNYEKLIDILKNKEKNSEYIIGILPVANHLGQTVEVTDYIKELNNEWLDAVKNMDDVTPLDFTDIAELYNIGEIFNHITDKVGHMPFSDEYYAAVGTKLARKICAAKPNPFKVIAVDCDNTLWKGVVGEDGALGVAVEEPYMEMQKLLIQKYNEGMLIVLSSKNNEADVWEVFDRNPHMILKRKHLTSCKINWESKYIGIRALAQELNLGIDSFIFIDDSAKECYEMMANNPQMLTLQLPEDPRQIPMFLKHVWAFDKEKFTEEDKSRTKLYQVERQRQEVQRESSTLEDFLKELNLKVYINEIEKEEVTRVAQLTQRTNQFNLSTIRRTEADIDSMIKNPQMKCWAIQVEDRFGEHGLTGVVIMKVKDGTAFLDTFLLSCRVLGRQVEDVVLVELCKYCKEKGISKIEADFYPTKKNELFEGYLRRNKWQIVWESEKCKRHEILVEDIYDSIDYIECHFCEERSRKQEEVFVSEVATTLEVQNSEQEYHLVESTWKVNINNEEELLHKNYLMQLNYCTGKKLLEIPKDGQKYINNNQVYEAPRNVTEEKMVAIWREVLGVEKIGINDNFFELGGHSVKAVKIVNLIHKRFNIEVKLNSLFMFPTIIEFSEFLSNSNISQFNEIVRLAEQEYYELSYSQKRLWLISQIEPDTNAYNLPVKIYINEDIDMAVVERVLYKLAKRHESMRTYFKVIDESPVQIISKDIAVNIKMYDLSTLQEQELRLEKQKIIQELSKPFNLEESPLFRACILKYGEASFEMVCVMHHIISDGWSLDVLGREFNYLYNAIKYGEDVNLEPLKIQYKDFAAWHNQLIMEKDRAENAKEYWKKQLLREIPILNLPVCNAFGRLDSKKSKGYRSVISSEIKDRLKLLAKQSNVSLFTLMITILNMYLSELTGQQDIIIATAGSGRQHDDLKNVMGYFVNTVILRNQVKPEYSLNDLIKIINSNTMDALEYQHYPIELIVEELKTNYPKISVFFNMLNISQSNNVYLDNLESYHIDEIQDAKFDIVFYVKEFANGIELLTVYYSNFYSEMIIENIIDQYNQLIERVIENPDTPLNELGQNRKKKKFKKN